MSPIKVLYFTSVIGVEPKQMPFESSEDVLFHEVVNEIAKKFGIANEQIAITSQMGETLTASDLNSKVKVIVKKYGTAFQVINRGVVGT